MLLRHLLVLLFLCPCGPALLLAQARLQSGPMLGYTEQREVMLWVQTTEPATVAIMYSDSTGTTFFTEEYRTRRAEAYTAKLVADRVVPGRRYDYRVLIDGREEAIPYPTTFRAQPTWRWRGDPPEFTLALGSCSYINEPIYDRPGRGYGGEYGIFRTIDSLNPDLMVWLGDNTYLREPDWYTRTGYQHRYTHTRSTAELQPLLARTHHYAIWDDHDYGPNDSDRSWIHKELAREVFGQFWANPTLGIPQVEGGITTHFQYLDTDFFLLDNRSFRTPNEQERDDNRTLLGEEQLEWLIESLVFSQSPWKMVCIGGQVLNTAETFETYANLAPAERAYLLRRIEEENISGVVFLSGDRHHTELSRLELGNGETVHEVTISPLTAGTGTRREEVNALRVEGTLVIDRNFGVLRFSGPFRERKIAVSVYDTDGALLWTRDLSR